MTELDALNNRPIDYSDIPAITPEEAKKATKYWKTIQKGEKQELVFA